MWLIGRVFATDVTPRLGITPATTAGTIPGIGMIPGTTDATAGRATMLDGIRLGIMVAGIVPTTIAAGTVRAIMPAATIVPAETTSASSAAILLQATEPTAIMDARPIVAAPLAMVLRWVAARSEAVQHAPVAEAVASAVVVDAPVVEAAEAVSSGAVDK